MRKTDKYMGFLNEGSKLFKDFYSRYSIAIFLILGVIFITTSCLLQDKNGFWYKAFYTGGTTMLSGGVFASIAKSMQFSEIFSKVLRDIIYAKEHLENRKDLEEMWKNLTSTLSKQKFDKISSSLQKNIKEYFLPLDHDYYYDDYNIEIEIEYNQDNSEYIDVKETIAYNIICEDETIPVKHESKCIIKSDYLDKGATKYNLVKLFINGVDITKKVHSKKEFIEHNLEFKYEYPLNGKKTYAVQKEDSKTYNIKYNRIKTHQALCIYNKLTVQIICPDDLKFDFRNLGTLNNFTTTVRHNNGNTIFKAKNNGLIYKNQGFVIVYN